MANSASKNKKAQPGSLRTALLKLEIQIAYFEKLAIAAASFSYVSNTVINFVT